MEQLQLSQQLVGAVQDALIEADPNAREPLVAMQYLSAIMGYALGKMNLSPADQQEVLEELAALTRHVMEDVGRQPRSHAPSGEAFGIWRPGDP